LRTSASAEYLAGVLRRDLPGMEVAGIAENGEEALRIHPPGAASTSS
jgi:hypothetical protein